MEPCGHVCRCPPGRCCAPKVVQWRGCLSLVSQQRGTPVSMLSRSKCCDASGPLPSSVRNCRCGLPLDFRGHHRAACTTAGVLGRRGFALESAAAREHCLDEPLNLHNNGQVNNGQVNNLVQNCTCCTVWTKPRLHFNGQSSTLSKNCTCGKYRTSCSTSTYRHDLWHWRTTPQGTQEGVRGCQAPDPVPPAYLTCLGEPAGAPKKGPRDAKPLDPRT